MIQIQNIKAVKNKSEVIKAVVDGAFMDRDNDALCWELIEREQQTATLIYPGISLPHVISSEVSETKIIFTLLENEVENWSKVGENCKICIFLLVKENEALDNLKKIKKVVAKLADESVCKQLLKVESRQELERLIATLVKEKNECQ